MVTILQVVPRLDAGGSELATIEIAQALSRVGARALVATEGGGMAEEVAFAGGEIVTLPVASKSPFTILANIGRIANLIEERGVDLVHARSRAPAWSAFLAARRTGKPFVTTYHGAYGEVGPFKAAYNSVMAQGRPRHRQFALHRLGDRSARAAREGPHPRHLSRRRSQRLRSCRRRCKRGRKSCRAQWGVPPGAKIVLHAARLTSIKGQRDLIAAAALANARAARLTTRWSFLPATRPDATPIARS